MDAEAKKTALRMIPYGLYVMTAVEGDEVAAATVNWVTQTAFEPPRLAVGVKKESKLHELVERTKRFVLNILGKDQGQAAYAFFKPVAPEGDRIGGEPFERIEAGLVLTSTPAHLVCQVVEIVDDADHSTVIAEVVDAHVRQAPEGRLDDATLWLKDLGEKVYYGG